MASPKSGKAETEAAARHISEHNEAGPREPAERRYKTNDTNDTTIEKLASC